MSPRRTFLCVVVLATLSAPPPAVAQGRHDLDLLIQGGRIADGTGNPWFEGDVGIRDGRVVEIGRVDPSRAARVLAAGGRVVAPGFIDVHTHVEEDLLERPAADNFVAMGVTTTVTGNCGFSALPLREWFAKLEAATISINVASLVGHNTVRRQGMNGSFDRPPGAEELLRMRGLVAEAMRDGAVGLSSGLEYVPGTYAKTEELAALARESAQGGGLYATHMRDEGNQVEDAIRESLAVGEEVQCPVQISHFKISSRKRWGASAISVRLVEEARKRGRSVTADQYVYTAGSTSLEIIFPAWLFDGGPEKVKERLADRATRQRVKSDMVAKAAGQGFPDFSFVQIAGYKTDPSLNGKRLPEIAALTGKGRTADAQAEEAVRMLEAGAPQVVVHKMAEEDVDRILVQPFVMIASDAGIPETEGPNRPHPRGFGNNARVLARYVRERRLLGLEEAIRKMTSLPAQTFGLWERGLLRPGLAADIVVFDPETVDDRATFEEPRQSPSGFEYVIVNGQVVVERGRHTGARPGRVIRGRGFRGAAFAGAPEGGGR